MMFPARENRNLTRSTDRQKAPGDILRGLFHSNRNWPRSQLFEIFFDRPGSGFVPRITLDRFIHELFKKLFVVRDGLADFRKELFQIIRLVCHCASSLALQRIQIALRVLGSHAAGAG